MEGQLGRKYRMEGKVGRKYRMKDKQGENPYWKCR